MKSNSMNTTHEEQAAQGIEALSRMVAERDILRADNRKYEVDTALMQQEIGQLKSLLATATAERDHYMRHSTELVTNLNNIQSVINSAIEQAGHAAYSRPTVPPPSSKPIEQPHTDTDNIRALIARLPKNGGSSDE
jgi:uncharacterized phage infection (PIP) family protein YhgE